MFSKSKKKKEKLPITYSTSSITQTQNTITTTGGIQTTTNIQRVSYREIRSSSSSTNLTSSLLSSSSGLTHLSNEQPPFSQIRSAFNQPIHNYTEEKKINFKDAQPFFPTTTTISKPTFGFQANQIKPNPTTYSNSNNVFKPGFQPNRINPTPSAFSNQNNIVKTGLQSNLAFNNELNEKLQIKVKKTGIYHGDGSKIPTYNTKSLKNRGKLLLINNIEFKDRKRHGADVDQVNIVSVFKQIGFDIEQYKNKTKSETERIVTSFARDLKKYDICVTVIMSHGTTIDEQTVIETIDGKDLPTEWVVQQFHGESCKGMNGKPKIFIFQCCRGDKSNTDVQTDAKMFEKPRKVQDILISYSTLPGFAAYRNPTLGSWYIQGLCKVFMEHAHDTHIEDLLKIVDGELAKIDAGPNHRQTSSYENRGFKICYLNPIK